MTKQIRDTLIFEEKEYTINRYILDTYLDKNTSLKNTFSGLTALYRGYVATFSIIDDFLFIKNLETYSRTGRLHFVSILKDNFPHSKKCDWFSGLLRIDKDKGYFDKEEEGHIFEYLEIYKGYFVGKRTMNYYELQQFKAKQFKHFKETEIYHRKYEYRIRANENPYEIDTYMMKNLLKFIEEIK